LISLFKNHHTKIWAANKSRRNMKRLENKVAIIYSDGSVGSATAKAFAAEGAKVFLTGRTQKKLDALTREIKSSGGFVETAVLDALDEKGIEHHINKTMEKTGQIDISFNAIGISQKGVQGIAVTELSLKSFLHPITTYLPSHFLTAKAAARHMVKQRKGVIIMHTPNASRTSNPFVGGMASSDNGSGITGTIINLTAGMVT
jgi:NAD(P)-dependent dehydrogenase (short-subunit alcohol dehydrogenase family)